jgi:hypothetical protein
MEIAKSASAKVNIGDYQSVDFFTSLKNTIDDPTPKEVRRVAANLQAMCNECLLNDLRAHFAARKKQYSDDQIRRMYGIPKPKTEPEFG